MSEAGQPPSRAKRLSTAMIALPQRLFLSVVAAGVFGGLALGAASVWFAATFGSSRPRD